MIVARSPECGGNIKLITMLPASMAVTSPGASAAGPRDSNRKPNTDTKGSIERSRSSTTNSIPMAFVPPRVFVDLHRRPPTYNLGALSWSFVA